MFLGRMKAAGAMTALVALTTAALPATAQVIYQNDFEANTIGFNVSDTISRPTGAGVGLSNTPQSTYLGRFGNGSAVLSLTGLTPGTVYSVAFDLFIEATMDGSEPWSLTSSSSGTLINTTFSNFFNQAYSDTTFLSTTPQDKPLFTGADVVGSTAVSNTERYSIYYFGRGAGNPLISFTANSANETLTFTGGQDQPVGDESWSLDNVLIQGPGTGTAVPEPATSALLALAALPVLGAVARRRRRAAQ